MYTEYTFNGKTYQFNTEASLAMGKDAFMAAHQHIPNRGEVWELIEKVGKKSEVKPEKKSK